MKLSISTSGTERKLIPGGYEFAPLEGLRQCKEAGFEYIDFNFANAADNGRPLSRNDWQTWMQTVVDETNTLGLTVTQSHSHWFRISGVRSEEEQHWHEEMVCRSLLATAMLGKNTWMVLHPQTIFDCDGYHHKKSIQHNVKVFEKLVSLAEKVGIGVCVENVFSMDGKREFGSQPEDLLELVEKVDSDRFGICWDFGHANRAKLNHLAALEMVLPYMKVTHVHDNNGKADSHFMPYSGNIPWKKILPSLKRFGYDGNLNMEVHVFYKGMPQSLRMDALRFLRRTGEEMIEIAEKA